MPRPTGCAPSVMTASTRSPTSAPTATRCAPIVSAAAWLRSLAVGPTGMSITTWVEPAAAFLDSTEATSCPSVSSSSGRSTRIRMSSAGLRPRAPPQAMQPPSRSTTRRSAGRSSVTGAQVSIVSAVPAGEVMAREEVFGMVRPKAVTIGTTTSVVRLPGSPPTECLSTMGAPSQVRRWPASIMARVRAAISPRSRRPAAHAVMKEAKWMSE
jgi:hypothetical protein